jgi:hypothetical protein
LLFENILLTICCKIKRTFSPKLAGLVSTFWKIAGEAVEQSFKKRCIINALDGTEVNILWGNSDLDCPDLESDLGKSVDSKCETGGTNEEDND